MILFVDTETTGKYDFRGAPGEKHQPKAVQVAAILMDENAREWACFNTLVRPRFKGESLEWEIPAEAQAIHGISTNDCCRCGLFLPVVLDALCGMAESAAVIVAHNIDFDAAVIVSEFMRESRDVPHVLVKRYCTMRESTPILRLPGNYGNFKWPKLTEAYEFFFKEQLIGAHDALADVRACARVYFELQRRWLAGANDV